MIPYGVGDMVVCIHDGEWNGNIGVPPGIVPTKGCVYTVRDIFPGGHELGSVYIRLVEIINSSPDNKRYGEAGFRADLFRPVKKTSIESLEKLCAPTPAPVKPEFV